MDIVNAKDCWNYYCTLSNDMYNTFRYVEPKNQENVFSFEYAKIIILSCTEIENVFKSICYIQNQSECGNIGEYKAIILKAFPNIVNTVVSIPRLDKKINPFAGWNEEKLCWWDAYTLIKHNREKAYAHASFQNAILALSALYVSIFYLAEISNNDFIMIDTGCIESDYADTILSMGKGNKLPDFVSK